MVRFFYELLKQTIMIKKLLFVSVLFYAVACNNSGSETTTTDSTTLSGTTGENSETASGTSTASSSLASFDESASYISLKTKKPVRVKADATRGYVVDYESNQPLDYYFYNPATRDTFDWSGNVVNGYLVLGDDGTYTLDEGKWKTKVDEDGDAKAKDGDDTKIKVDGNGTDAKIKTDSTKTKVSASGTKTKRKD
jgi:hypothetical protein